MVDSVRIRAQWFAAIVLFATVFRLAANDTNARLGAGGLVPEKSADIVMESEDLIISVHQITVRYLFRNTSDRDLDLIVAFPLPEVDGAAVANIPIFFPSPDPLNFMQFKVLVAGKQIVPRIEVRSFYEGAEITSQLRALGLPLSALDRNVAAAMSKLTAADRQKVEKSGWVDCSATKDGRCWPYWSSRIQFYWTQHFSARSTLEITHTYRPVVGGGALYGGDDPADVGDYFPKYCASPDALARIATRLKKEKFDGSRAVLQEREIQYILTTANNWRGPIRRFHLSILADSPEDEVLACMPDLKRVAPDRYELFRSNFHPDREIELLILQPSRR